MQDLEDLYEKCRFCIRLKVPGMTSSDALALYAFAEQYAINTSVSQEVINAAKEVINKYQGYADQL